MRNDVDLVIWIERVRLGSGGNLISQLIAPKLDTARRIQFGYVNPHAFLSKMLGHTAKIFNSEFLPEAKNPVNQDNIHSGG